MLEITCSLWGSWPVEGLGPTYAAKLESMVARHLTQPYRFNVFVDEYSRHDVWTACSEAARILPMSTPSYLGCLPKLGVFNPDNGLERGARVLNLDLDTVITGNIDQIASYNGELAVRATFRPDPTFDQEADGDMASFEADSTKAHWIWETFCAQTRHIEQWTQGRERLFLRECNPEVFQRVMPHNYILSYKTHLRGRPPGPETRLVSFHDKNSPTQDQRPHALVDKVDWIKEHWR